MQDNRFYLAGQNSPGPARCRLLSTTARPARPTPGARRGPLRAADVEAGRVAPLAEFAKELRAKHGLSRRSRRVGETDAYAIYHRVATEVPLRSPVWFKELIQSSGTSLQVPVSMGDRRAAKDRLDFPHPPRRKTRPCTRGPRNPRRTPFLTHQKAGRPRTAAEARSSIMSCIYKVCYRWYCAGRTVTRRLQ